jgi:hypothetical protein
MDSASSEEALKPLGPEIVSEQDCLALASDSVASGLSTLDLRTEYPWVLSSPVVHDVAREAMREVGRDRIEPEAADLLQAGRRVIAAAARQATVNPEEALGAIGWIVKRTTRQRRHEMVARARLNKPTASGRHWASHHRAEVERLIAEELFVVFAYNKPPPMDRTT